MLLRWLEVWCELQTSARTGQKGQSQSVVYQAISWIIRELYWTSYPPVCVLVVLSILATESGAAKCQSRIVWRRRGYYPNLSMKTSLVDFPARITCDGDRGSDHAKIANEGRPAAICFPDPDSGTQTGGRQHLT